MSAKQEAEASASKMVEESNVACEKLAELLRSEQNMVKVGVERIEALEQEV